MNNHHEFDASASALPHPRIKRLTRRLWPVLLLAMTFCLLNLPGPSRAASVAAGCVTICLQDDSNHNTLSFDLGSGKYTFSNCDGFCMGGVGQVTVTGSTITLKDVRSDRRFQASVDLTQLRGRANFQRLSPSALFTIIDRNTDDDECGCKKGDN